MPETDRDYFARRADEERRAAARAGSDEARSPHALLAACYAGIAAALEEVGEQADEDTRRAIVSRVSIEAQRKAAASPASGAPVRTHPRDERDA